MTKLNDQKSDGKILSIAREISAIDSARTDQTLDDTSPWMVAEEQERQNEANDKIVELKSLLKAAITKKDRLSVPQQEEIKPH